MVKSPPQYLHKLNMFYADKYGYTLPKVLEKELGGQLEFCAEFMLNMKLKPIETISGLVDEACRGFGTRELLLTVSLTSSMLNLLPKMKLDKSQPFCYLLPLLLRLR